MIHDTRQSLLPYIIIPLSILLAGCTLRNKQGGSRRDGKIRKMELYKKTPQKRVKDMTLDEAITAARFYEEHMNSDHLIMTYQGIIAKSQHEPDIAATYLIKLADFYLGISNFDEAKKQYRKVIGLYPGFAGIERARYREVVAHFWSSLGPTRDQSATHTTITLGKQYLEDFKDAAPFCEKIRTMIAASYRTVLEYERGIVEFYINRYFLSRDNEKPLRAALQRLEIIRTELLPDLVRFIPEAAPLKTTLLIEQDDDSDITDPAIQEMLVKLLQEKMLEITAVIKPLALRAKTDVATAAALRDRF